MYVKKMGKKLTIMLDDATDKRLRETVFKAKGMRKGNLSEAIEEAIELWIEKELSKSEKSERNNG